jgi:hypothetical protein
MDDQVSYIWKELEERLEAKEYRASWTLAWSLAYRVKLLAIQEDKNFPFDPPELPPGFTQS